MIGAGKTIPGAGGGPSSIVVLRSRGRDFGRVEGGGWEGMLETWGGCLLVVEGGGPVAEESAVAFLSGLATVLFAACGKTLCASVGFSFGRS